MPNTKFRAEIHHDRFLVNRVQWTPVLTSDLLQLTGNRETAMANQRSRSNACVTQRGALVSLNYQPRRIHRDRVSHPRDSGSVSRFGGCDEGKVGHSDGRLRPAKLMSITSP